MYTHANKMANLSLILFNFNFLLPLALIGMLSLAISLNFHSKARRGRMYKLASNKYQQILTAKPVTKLKDNSLTICFYSLLVVKLCVRIIVVYMNHS